MFRSATNPYDEIVVKATDENQTSENWEIILNLCDKVSDEGEQGARNVIAALLKRLAHRNANVQLYSLALAEALSKNCGIEVHREIASRAFTQGLEKLVTDRYGEQTGHDKVKKKTLTMIQHWATEWKDDPTLGIMNECYESLKAKNIKFEQSVEEPPPQVGEDIRRQEEEELQRVLELSMQDKGGRSWAGYSPSPGASSSKDNLPGTAAGGSSSSKAQATKPQATQPTGGYAASSSRRAVDVVHDTQSYHNEPIAAPTPPEAAYKPAARQAAAPVVEAPLSVLPVTVAVPPASTANTANAAQPPAVPDLATATRVRALHNFEPAAAGELAFEKGDVIKVVDRTHKDWWKGQLKGRTGIFPVNYVEAMPEPTMADLTREAEAEASIFAQAANIDRLLSMLRNFDISKDNLADDDEIQELYRASLGVRPKIIRLIEKYNQKKVELALMNDNFVNAKELFDRMMEESLAKHNPNAYPFNRHPSARPPNGDFRGSTYWGGQQYPQGPPNFYPPGAFPEGAQANYPPQVYPPQMDPAGYPPQQPYPGQDPAAYQPPHQNPAYPGQQPFGPHPVQDPAYGGQPQPQPQPQQYDPNAYGAHPQVDPNAYQGPPQQNPGPGQPAQQPGQTQPGYDPNAYNPQQQQPGQPQPSYDPTVYTQPQPSQTQPVYDVNSSYPQPAGQGPPAFDPNAQYAGASGAPQPSAQSPAGETPQPNMSGGGATSPDPMLAQDNSYQAGPPYIYDPNGQYPDPNAQAWAQYYAQGGTDPQGAVYFHSVPGVKEPAGASPPANPAGTSPLEASVQQTQSMQPVVYEQPQQQQQQMQQPQHQPAPAEQSATTLSPKSAANQLKASPKSGRMTMAGVGTLSGHPSLKDHLPTYVQERHGKRPSSAGGQTEVGVGSPMGATPWVGQPQPMDPGVRTTSPGGTMSPWAHVGSQGIELPRAGSTSPPTGYRPPQAGHHAAMSPGGSFKPASAGPDFHSNQVTPYPAHRSNPSQQQSYASGNPGP